MGTPHKGYSDVTNISRDEYVRVQCEGESVSRLPFKLVQQRVGLEAAELELFQRNCFA
jgi:hypothetical protein